MQLAARLHPVIPQPSANCVCLEWMPQLRRDVVPWMQITQVYPFPAEQTRDKAALMESKTTLSKVHSNLPTATAWKSIYHLVSAMLNVKFAFFLQHNQTVILKMMKMKTKTANCKDLIAFCPPGSHVTWPQLVFLFSSYCLHHLWNTTRGVTERNQQLNTRFVQDNSVLPFPGTIFCPLN